MSTTVTRTQNFAFARRLLESPGAVVGLVIIVALVILAAAAS